VLFAKYAVISDAVLNDTAVVVSNVYKQLKKAKILVEHVPPSPGSFKYKALEKAGLIKSVSFPDDMRQFLSFLERYGVDLNDVHGLSTIADAISAHPLTVLTAFGHAVKLSFLNRVHGTNMARDGDLSGALVNVVSKHANITEIRKFLSNLKENINKVKEHIGKRDIPLLPDLQILDMSYDVAERIEAMATVDVFNELIDKLIEGIRRQDFGMEELTFNVGKFILEKDKASVDVDDMSIKDIIRNIELTLTPMSSFYSIFELLYKYRDHSVIAIMMLESSFKVAEFFKQPMLAPKEWVSGVSDFSDIKISVYPADEEAGKELDKIIEKFGRYE